MESCLQSQSCLQDDRSRLCKSSLSLPGFSIISRGRQIPSLQILIISSWFLNHVQRTIDPVFVDPHYLFLVSQSCLEDDRSRLCRSSLSLPGFSIMSRGRWIPSLQILIISSFLNHVYRTIDPVFVNPHYLFLVSQSCLEDDGSRPCRSSLSLPGFSIMPRGRWIPSLQILIISSWFLNHVQRTMDPVLIVPHDLFFAWRIETNDQTERIKVFMHFV